MKPVSTITGTMLPLDRADIDTDQIIPQQFLKRTERNGYGDFLFYNWARDDEGVPKPDFITHHPERSEAKVLVAGPNFGCGSSREHAAWALQDWGFEAVIAPSIADIFKGNAINIGLLPIELGRANVNALVEVAADPNAAVTIDLPAQTITVGATTIGFDIDPAVKQRLISGIDRIGETLAHEEAIARHEASRPDWLPRTTVAGTG